MKFFSPHSSGATRCLFAAFAGLALASAAQAQLTVKKEDIKDNLFAFRAVGVALQDVGGALESSENVAYNAWEFPEGPSAGAHLYYLYADSKGNADQAHFILKWDFSKSGHQIKEVEIPHNRFYFQFESGSTVEEVLGVISYSVDGKEWVELDQFTPDTVGLNPEQPVKFQDNPLYVVLEKPADTFFYKVELRVRGGAFFGQAFQWQRMGQEPEVMRPDYFAVNFSVGPKP